MRAASCQPAHALLEASFALKPACCDCPAPYRLSKRVSLRWCTKKRHDALCQVTLVQRPYSTASKHRGQDSHPVKCTAVQCMQRLACACLHPSHASTLLTALVQHCKAAAHVFVIACQYRRSPTQLSSAVMHAMAAWSYLCRAQARCCWQLVGHHVPIQLGGSRSDRNGVFD